MNSIIALGKTQVLNSCVRQELEDSGVVIQSISSLKSGAADIGKRERELTSSNSWRDIQIGLFQSTTVYHHIDYCMCYLVT